VKDNEDIIADYSLAGPQVALTAPGGAKANKQIISTKPGGGYGGGSGTSHATAHVAGSIALALQSNSKLSFQDVRDLLQGTAADLAVEYNTEQQGAGLLNVKDMMETLE
jgi:subtilisin family serine protease